VLFRSSIMKEESQYGINEVRCKLHITTPYDSQVKNSWMCLNYNQKPTISHIVEHIKRNFLSNTCEESQIKAASIQLFLDDYWLPPYENSRLIRENDCIKVDLNLEKYSEDGGEAAARNTLIKYEKLNNLNKYSNTNINEYAYKYINSDSDNNKNYITYQQHQQQDQSKNSALAQFYHELSKINNKRPLDETTTTKTATTKQATSSQEKKPKQQPAKKFNSSQAKSLNQEIKCHKKFSIGSYVHLLNEPVEPPVKDNTKAVNSSGQNSKHTLYGSDEEEDYVEAYQVKSNTQQKDIIDTNTSKKSVSSSTATSANLVDLDKIAAKINSTGQQKWKNSTMPAKSTGPKHIIFSSSSDSGSSSSTSSDSSSDSSDSTDSSDSDDESSTHEKIAKMKSHVVVAAPAVSTASNATRDIKSAEKKEPVFFEQTKEEQLKAKISNESYLVTNPSNLNEFNKKFNAKKLNSAYEFNTSSSHSQASSSVLGKASHPSEMEEFVESSFSKKNKRPTSPAISYEKCVPLIGQPRLNDKIAFQILEISSNFTPELSGFKTGTVNGFDPKTNEVSLLLHSKYNSILKKPNKFSVVIDDGEDEVETLKNNENFLNNDSIHSNRSNSSSSTNSSYDELAKKNWHEEILNVDWRNLTNVKLLPHNPV